MHLRQVIKEHYITELSKFGALIKKYRKKNNLTQLDLAEKMKIERSEISKIENGKLNIEFRTIIKLADALKIHPKKFFNFEFEFEFEE